MGIVTEVGSGASGWKVGDRAGIGCFVRTCRECKQCHRSTDQYCPKMVRRGVCLLPSTANLHVAAQSGTVADGCY